MSRERSEKAEMPRTISPDAPNPAFWNTESGWRKREASEGVKVQEILKRSKYENVSFGDMINMLQGSSSSSSSSSLRGKLSSSPNPSDDAIELFGMLTHLDHPHASLSPLNLFHSNSDNQGEIPLVPMIHSHQSQYRSNTPALIPQEPKVSMEHFPYFDINLHHSSNQISRDEIDQMLAFDKDEEENQDQSKNFESQMIEHEPPVDSPEEFSDSVDQDDKDASGKSNVAFKRSCKICTERRVRCSGPPGPCKTCLKKGLSRDMCVFLPRRKPGPKKREFDMLIGLNSTLALTDEQFVSESIHLVFSEFAISVQVQNMISELCGLGYLEMNLDLNVFPSLTYSRKCIIRAVRLWLTVFGAHVLEITCAEFIHTMKSYQEFGGEDHSLSDSDLEMLFWLVCPNLEKIPSSVWPNRMQLTQLCLAFMWLGPANDSNRNPASLTVKSIFKWLNQKPERLVSFQGFCSKSEIERKLKNGSNAVHYLIEGKVECLKIAPAKRKNNYKIRALGKSFLKQDENGTQVVCHELVSMNAMI